MAKKEQLINYIRQSINLGIPRETIKNTLLSSGWKKKDIEKYFLKPHIISKRQLIKDIPSISLRYGLAFVFIYAGIVFTLDPQKGLQYVPKLIQGIIDPKIFVSLFTAYEFILSAWLIWGKWSRYSGFVTAITTIAITLPNLDQFNLLFRNVAIFSAAIALSTLDLEKK